MIAAALALPGAARAETLRVLTAGAFKSVLIAVLPQFETSERRVQWENDTVGNLVKRIEGGEGFDLVIASPSALATLSKSGKTVGAVRVTEGTGGSAQADTNTAVIGGSTNGGYTGLQALLAAKGVAYIDPVSGGSSGIYVSGLLDKLGIGPEIKAKAVLVPGGYAAERVAKGEAELAIHQISEILPVKGVVLAGPLPPEIQNYTIYSAGIASDTKQKPSAQALIELIGSKDGAAATKSKGMEPMDQSSAVK